MKLDPRLRKFLGLGLIGTGALTVMSGVVGLLNTWQLVDASVEQSIGITRSDFVRTYAVFVLVGAALIFFGWRLKKDRAR